MKYFQSIPEITDPQVVAIGTFDGLHRGHRHLLNRARERASERGVSLAVITFEPDPETVLAGVPPTKRRLLSHPDKISLLDSLGVDHLYEVEFDREFASVEAEDFISRFLLDRLSVSCLCVGSNFRFGRRREGDSELLESMLPPNGVELEIIKPRREDGEVISSTRIRRALREGRPLDARHLLGRPYVMYEEVIPGDGRGREIGYPTLNFRINRTIHPRHGVYSAWIQSDRFYPSVANFGHRPTVDPESAEPVLEVHSLEGDPGISYHEETHVYLGEFLRDEEEFESIEALTEQIEQDCQRAKDSLQGLKKPAEIKRRVSSEMSAGSETV